MANASHRAQRNVRAAAAKAIATLINEKQSLRQQIPLLSAPLNSDDHGLLRELCFGSARLLPRLQALADPLLKKPLRRKDGDIYALLLLGIYQLETLRIPDHAVLNTTVDAAKALGKPWARGLINAVLREFLRQRSEIMANLTPPARDAHPEWLWSLIHQRWPDQADQIITANNSAPPFSLRVSCQKTSRTAYLEQLTQKGIGAQPTPNSPDGIVLNQALPVTLLPDFENGWVSVQDESAQFSAPLVAANRPTRILDACCAPGGKTGHLRELLPDAVLHALELHPNRLAKVAENLTRMGNSATLICGDALDPGTWWDGKTYDAILLDAPCTASGVLRRNPDIKTLRHPEDAARMAEIQKQILAALWPLLNVNGQLVYVTCSIFEEENNAIIGSFLGANANAEEFVIDASWGQAQQHGRQLLPKLGGGDGFYHACLRKIA